VDDAIYQEILRLRQQGEGAALATVTEVRGSSPAKDPMKMLVRRDGSSLGSVGGGGLEAEVRKLALRVIDEDRSARYSAELDPASADETALICGGSVQVFIEPVTAPSLVLFGAGHVSRAVAGLAAPVGFRVVVVDDRPVHASLDRFPMAAEVLAVTPEDASRRLKIGPDTYVLVLTRSHAEDERVLGVLLETFSNPRYLGLLGSSTKIETIFSALRSRGADPQWLSRIHAPVGLKIGARMAEEIAVAIVAEMIACRRGSQVNRTDP